MWKIVDNFVDKYQSYPQLLSFNVDNSDLWISTINFFIHIIHKTCG